MNFLYDENGVLYGFIKDNSSKYFYIRDVYQNILGIIDNTGAIVVKYIYDAWGNHTVLNGSGNVNTADGFIGNINPFRYKGYYYDKESNMYYCKSRYYVPEWCRWLNADNVSYLDPKDISSMNLFAYCGNNPINYMDPSGNFFLLGFIIGAVIGAAVGFGAVAYMDYQDDGEIFNGSIAWQAYLGATLFGGAVGGILGGYVLPALSHMSFSIPTGLKLLTDTAGVSHFVVTSAVTITGGQVIAGAGTLAALDGLTYMFSQNANRYKPKDNRPNYVQNKEFKRVCNDYGLNDSQRDRIHHKISKKGYTDEEIRELIKKLFPNLFRK